MFRLKSVTLKNFLSVGNVTQAIKLDDHGLTLVLGNNSDSNGGITKNGAGKTAILQAISFGLYGAPLTRIKIDNLINNINQRGMVVTVDFENDGKDYRIERGRKPNILKFFVNGEEIEDMSRGENRETQIDISSIIGMSHTMFTHIVALNTYTTPFLKMKAGEQREVSEELLGVTQISTRAETLKKLINETKEGIRQETANISAVQEANQRITAAITKAETQWRDWQDTHDRSVVELATQIEDLQGIDFDAEKAMFDQLDAWQQHRRGLTGRLDTETTTLRRLDQDISANNQAIAKLANHQTTLSSVVRLEAEKTRKEQTVTEVEMSVAALVAKLAAKIEEVENPDSHECVTCSQPLAGTDHLATVIANLQRQQKKLETDIANKQGQIVSLKEDIEAIDAEVISIRTEEQAQQIERTRQREELEAIVGDLQTKIAAQRGVIENIKDEMAGDDDRPNTFFNDRDELYATKHLLDNCVLELERERVKANPHVQHLDSLRSTLQAVGFEEIDRLQELLRHQDFLLNLLTNKSSFIRKKIIDQNLFYLNTRLNFYLEKLGLPHEVVFQNDLTVDIVLLGRDFDFEQLSRGEMNRIIMAVSWSFRDVWESLNHSINLIWVDELIDNGLDSNGAEAALGIMKSFSRNRKNVFLISHRDELVGRIDRTLLVTKDNGFTTIAEDLT